MPERRAARCSIAPGVRRAAAAVWELKARVAIALGGVLLTAIVLVTAWAGRAASRIDLQSLTAPSLVYAAGRALDPGVSVSAADLAGTLARLGYRERTDEPRDPGEFRRTTGAWDIFLRARSDPGGHRGPLRVRLDVAGDHVRAVVDPTSGKPLVGVALEPELLGELGDLAHRSFRPVALSTVPGHLIDAVLAIEDERFFEHVGVDPKAIARAAWANLHRRKIVQGGSTITQQVVQGFDVGPRRAWIRKIRDAALALAIERRYSKSQILEAYLNAVYLGQDGPVAIYGVGAAAAAYFGKTVETVDLAEAALLAGMIHGPNRYWRDQDPAVTRARRDLVLRRMRDSTVIRQRAFLAAASQPIRLAPTNYGSLFGAYFFDRVHLQAEKLTERFGTPLGGLRIYTSLDPVLQHAADVAVVRGLDELERRYADVRRGEHERRLQAAVIALDARTGEIRALVGGRQWWQSQFDRATQARRHPGSAFKPFVYLAALRAGPRGELPRLTAASLVRDEQLTVQLDDETWTSRGRFGLFLGPISMRLALQESLNAPAVWTALTVGIDAVIRTARDMGFTSTIVPRPTLALGGLEVTPLELASAYATLANGGQRVSTGAIRAVVDGRGAVTSPPRQPARVIAAEEAFVVTDLLRTVMEEGTGARARLLGVNAAMSGKTGSTNRDAWVAGYTPRLVTIVWVGFDEYDTLRLTGARGAVPIWADFMRTATEVVPGGSFAVPGSVVFRNVDPTTGKLATPFCPIVRREPFLPTAVPTETCAEHQPHIGHTPAVVLAESR